MFINHHHDKNLEYVKSVKRLIPHQDRWTLYFTHFNFDAHISTWFQESNVHALSRIFENSHTKSSSESCFTAPVQWEIMKIQ